MIPLLRRHVSYIFESQRWLQELLLECCHEVCFVSAIDHDKAPSKEQGGQYHEAETTLDAKEPWF